MIPYGHHFVSDDDVLAVSDALRSEWLTTGPLVDAFESSLSEATGGVSCVAVSSGTTALHTAYAAAGISRGDEVITPPLTFIATQAALVHLGAHPIYADVTEDTGNIDPEAVEQLVTSRTSAIVAVDYAGHPADLLSLKRIAERHGLLLIEDASHSLGSSLDGKPVGSIADATTFSFFPTKNITTAEGGAVASPHIDLAIRARRYSRQGLVRNEEEFLLPDEGPWHQEVHSLGHNFRLSDVHAALGMSQIRRLYDFKLQRIQIKEFYDSNFSSIEELNVPHQRPGASVMWHLYPLRVPPQYRRGIFEYLRDHGVGVQVNYLPAYRHPALARLLQTAPNCPNAEEYYSREISLPMWPGLLTEQLTKVVDLVKSALREVRVR